LKLRPSFARGKQGARLPATGRNGVTQCRRLGLLNLLIAAAVVVVAGPAGATTIHPDSTKVSGQASNFKFAYGAFSAACNTSTAAGTTGVSAANLSLTVTFSDTSGGCPTNQMAVSCTISGGTMTLAATATGSGNGTAKLTIDSPGYTLSCGSGFCVIAIGAQTSSSTPAVTFATGTDALEINAFVTVTRTGLGGALCGAASGTAKLTAIYTVTPTNLTITNP
jgi:hypothetical protein